MTLTGIYSTSKTVYATYIPASACDLIESLAVRLITIAAPALMKVPEGEALPDLEKLDTMLAEALSVGDNKIDSLISDSTTKVTGAYATVKTTVTDKVGEAKTFVIEKVEENKTMVMEKVDQVKAAVANKMEDEQIAAMVRSPCTLSLHFRRSEHASKPSHRPTILGA